MITVAPNVEAPPETCIVANPVAFATFANLLQSAYAAITSYVEDPVITVSSWYRNPLYNLSVGGQRDDQHEHGLAIDMVGLHSVAFGFEWRNAGGVWVTEATHEHLQTFPKGTLLVPCF